VTKLTGAALDRAVANAMGLKSVNNCEKWGTSMTQEALKLALEALERSVATCFDQYAHQQVMSQPDHFINKAITALRLAIDVQNTSESTYKEALAQPEQEPVAWVQDVEFEQSPEFAFSWVKTKLHDKPLYTSPPQCIWVELMDEEREQVINANTSTGLWHMAKDIEAKLKEKNT
jgi:hypothetical protein